MRFKKKPLYNNNKTMKTQTKYIIWAAVVIIAYTMHAVYLNAHAKNLKQELIGTQAALELQMKPTKIEALSIELELNRIERVNIQSEIDIKIEAKKKKAQRADEIQDEMRVELGL